MKGELRSERQSAFRQQLLLVVFLWLVLLVLSLMVVYSSYDVRVKFNELAELRTQQDKLRIVWSQYVLEESALTPFERIEETATEKLSMQVPNTWQITLVYDDES
ncbi:cell division protein FtsL [Candidatus Endobugula sertula]|uniref:Cell division protein FtsL n=1 Tax=Candidatus Endobugula sertula TaxID=62101 RepID=A0A1D2QTM2_9GAMM|nr:cell division protein FtsL [Candidatus Endobugula sertula]